MFESIGGLLLSNLLGATGVPESLVDIFSSGFPAQLVGFLVSAAVAARSASLALQGIRAALVALQKSLGGLGWLTTLIPGDWDDNLVKTLLEKLETVLKGAGAASKYVGKFSEMVVSLASFDPSAKRKVKSAMKPIGKVVKW